jgi:hypothetical protein
LHDTKSDRLNRTAARSRINTCVRPLVAALCVSLAAAALAAPVAVPNSDFSWAANNGSVGGGPLGGMPDHAVFKVFWDVARADTFAPPRTVLELHHTKAR